MDDRKMREKIQRAMDTRLSGLTGDPALCQRVMNQSVPQHSRRFSLALAAALLLALLGVTAAAAHGSAVLAYLFGGNDNAAQPYEARVEEIGAHFACSGLQMTVCDALIKDGEISFGLSMIADRPTYIMTKGIYLSDASYDISQSNIEEMWVGNDPTGEKGRLGREIIHGCSLPLPQQMAQDEEILVEMQMVFLLPKAEVAFIDTYAEDEAVWQAIDAAVARGQTPVEEEEPFAVLLPRAYWGDEQIESFARVLGDAQGIEQYAQMEGLMQATVRFYAHPNDDGI